MIEFNAVDFRFAPHERILDVLRHGVVRKNSCIRRLRLVVFAGEAFALLSLDLGHEHLAGDAEVPVV